MEGIGDMLLLFPSLATNLVWICLEIVKKLWPLFSTIVDYVNGKLGSVDTDSVMILVKQMVHDIWWLLSGSGEYLLVMLRVMDWESAVKFTLESLKGLWQLFLSIVARATGVVSDEKVGVMNTDKAMIFKQEKLEIISNLIIHVVQTLQEKFISDDTKRSALGMLNLLSNSTADVMQTLQDKFLSDEAKESALEMLNLLSSWTAYMMRTLHEKLFSDEAKESSLQMMKGLLDLMSYSALHISKFVSDEKNWSAQGILNMFSNLAAYVNYVMQTLHGKLFLDEAKQSALEMMKKLWDLSSYYAAYTLKLLDEKIPQETRDKWLAVAMPWLILAFIVLILKYCCCRRIPVKII